MIPLAPGEIASMQGTVRASLPGRCTITRESGRGAATQTRQVAQAIPYRRGDPSGVRLAAIAGGAASENRELLLVQCGDVQPKDVLVDDAEPTLRFHVDGVGEMSDALVQTVYATRKVGP